MNLEIMKKNVQDNLRRILKTERRKVHSSSNQHRKGMPMTLVQRTLRRLERPLRKLTPNRNIRTVKPVSGSNRHRSENRKEQPGKR